MKQFVYAVKQYQNADGEAEDELAEVVVPDQVKHCLYPQFHEPRRTSRRLLSPARNQTILPRFQFRRIYFLIPGFLPLFLWGRLAPMGKKQGLAFGAKGPLGRQKLTSS